MITVGESAKIARLFIQITISAPGENFEQGRVRFEGR